MKVTIQNARPLKTIAADIIADWKMVYFGAVPYVDAMRIMDRMTDEYGCESAESIVMYFLANASTWRGAKAREIKAELKAMLVAE